jgi:hypothetical protein
MKPTFINHHQRWSAAVNRDAILAKRYSVTIWVLRGARLLLMKVDVNF